MAVFFGAVLLCCGLGSLCLADELTHDAKQLVVCLAPDAQSSEGKLQRFHRDAQGAWQADGKPWPVLFGRYGLAWGRGLHPAQSGSQKVEGDRKNPMGLFKIGQVLGYAPKLPEGSHDWPYHQVTDRDAWIDDPALSDLPYNHLYTLPPGAPYPSWWQKEHMHLDDFAYEWLVLIEHNYTDPDPKAGNEIYFHVRRGEHYRTAGCTTMELSNLERLIKWLDPKAQPVLAELTRAEYQRLWQEWGLPPPSAALIKP